MIYEELLAFSKNFNRALFEDLQKVQERFQLNTLRRLRYFLAQTSYESRDFKSFTESMYYTTPERIAAVWPTRFTCNGVGRGPLDANLYVRSAEKLANEVYGGRMGNNEVGDGFKYIGRGAIQLTGKDNYTRCSIELFDDLRLVEDPDLVSNTYPLLTAGWFWYNNGLNELADRDEYTNVTARITGARGNNLTTEVRQRLPNLKRANQCITQL